MLHAARRLIRAVMLLRLSLVFALMMLSCSRAQVASPPATKPITITSPTPNVEPARAPTPTQLIRAIDFNNVAFPPYPVYIGDRGKKKYITIKPGDLRSSLGKARCSTLSRGAKLSAPQLRDDLGLHCC